MTVSCAVAWDWPFISHISAREMFALRINDGAADEISSHNILLLKHIISGVINCLNQLSFFFFVFFFGWDDVSGNMNLMNLFAFWISVWCCLVGCLFLLSSYLLLGGGSSCGALQVRGCPLEEQTNTDTVYKKSKLFLRQLRSFNLCRKLLEIYPSVALSAISCAVVCWRSSTREPSGIDMLIHKAGTIIGQNVKIFELVKSRSSNKLFSFMVNPCNPLCYTLQRQWSSFSNRLILLHCHNERYRKSFLVITVTLYNNSSLCDRWAHCCSDKVLQ